MVCPLLKGVSFSSTVNMRIIPRIMAALGLCLALVCSMARAQVVDGRQIVTPELLNGGLEADGTMLVGLRFVMEPGWYLYWKNPGDSGLPVAVTWELPNGVTASELQFPTPQKFNYEGIVAYGYKNELVLLTKLSSDGQRSLSEIRAKLDWLVCKESCIRGTATVELPSTPTAREIFARVKRQLPRKLSDVGLSVKNAGLTRQSNQLKLAVEFEGEAARKISDFYPDVIDDAVIDFQSITVADGKVALTVEPYSPETSVTVLRGLVIVDGAGYECVIPLR
jgi:DsbC/DsbD-like thiol-disulfide interchange protein